jgi:hypothetical protein
MHGSRIPIWFFIGVLLVVYGVMILGYGVYELASGSYPPTVQLTELHTPIWWGALLAALGLFYVLKFRPGRQKQSHG